MHDVRRTVATRAGGAAGLNAFTIMALFGWTRAEQAAAYIQPVLDPLRAGADAIAAHIPAAFHGITIDGEATVVATDTAEMKDRLAAALAEIERLKAQLNQQ